MSSEPTDAPRGVRALPGVGVRTARTALANRIVGLGAEIAFFVLLSVPPALLAVLASLGFVSDVFGEGVADTIEEQLLTFGGGFLAEQARADVLEPAVESLLDQGRPGIISFGVLIAIWAASRAVGRTIEGVAIAYDLEDRRSKIRQRLLALGVTVVGMLVLLFVLPVLVAGPRLLEFLSEPLGLTEVAATVWRYLYWPALGLLGVGLLATFYHLAAPWKTPWRRDLPGAVTAAVLWLAAATGLRAYAAVAVDDGTFGPLGVPLVFLFWVLASSLAVLVGAELNAEIERTWPSLKEPKGEEPGDGARRRRDQPVEAAPEAAEGSDRVISGP
jgi:membrane protein